MLADLPGLIEGASEGAGLGTRFLGHVERCAVILHLIDGTADDVVDAYRTIRARAGHPTGMGSPTSREMIGLNKIDAIDPEDVKRKCRTLARAAGRGATVLPLSGVSGAGVSEILRALLGAIEAERAETDAAALVAV